MNCDQNTSFFRKNYLIVISQSTLSTIDNRNQQLTSNALVSIDHSICVKDVYLTYGKGSSAVLGLNGTSMKIKKGTIYALLGPSGCGKTSLLRCLLGCIKPQMGTVRVFGYTPQERGSEIPGPGVGYMPQDIALNEDLTIHEMLTYFGKLAFMDRQCIKLRIFELLSILAIPDRHQIISTLSGGQKRRVSFLCAIINKPKLLMLDEPTVGVDPILREKIWNILIECTETMKTTVIITTHYIEESKRANRIGFMRNGKLLAEDTPKNLLTRSHCQTLEEVFYKLCSEEKEKSKMDRNYLRWQIQESTFDHRSVDHNFSLLNSVSNFNCNQWLSILLTVLWKVTIQSIRFRGALLVQLILPIFSLTIYCLCVGGVAMNVPLAVVNEESPPFLSEIYLRNIDPKIINIVNYTDIHSAKKALRRNKVWSILYINPNFSQCLMKRYENIDEFENETLEMCEIQVTADLTNRVLTITLERALGSALQGFFQDTLNKLPYNPRLLDTQIKIEEVIHGKLVKIFDYTHFMIPGLLISLTYTFSFFSALFLALIEKNEKIFDRNRVVGVTTTHIILSYSISRCIVMSIVAIVLVVISVVFFDLPTKGSLFWTSILLLLQILTGLTMGIMVSTLCANFYTAMVVSNGILLFVFIMSGVVWPTESLPYWMEWFSIIQPTTLPTKSLRNILSRGLKITDFSVYRGFFVSIAYTAIFFSVSIILFPH